MEVVGGVMLPFVKRNDKVPLRVTKTLTTEDDYQTSVPITVFQGERPKTKDNVKLGHFDLGGIPPVKRGVPQIEVTFEVDEDSILHVSAVDTASKNTHSITITDDMSRLSNEQIQKMIDDAEANADKDKVWRLRQEKAQELEHYIYEMKHALDTPSVKDTLSGLNINTVTKALNAAAQWMDENKGAGSELHELEEETKSFEAKLVELKAKVDPIVGKLYTPTSNTAEDDSDEPLHEEL
jgi:heat shock protein 5